MRKIWFVASREFFATVATRGFIIGMLIVPLMVVIGSTVVPRLAALKGPRVRGEIALIDPTGLVGPNLSKTMTPEALAARRLANVAAVVSQARPDAGRPGHAGSQGQSIANMLGDVPLLTLVQRAPDSDLQNAKSWLWQAGTQGPRRLAVIDIHSDAVTPASAQAAYGTYDFYKPPTLDEETENEIKASVREAIVAARLGSINLDAERVHAMLQVDAPVSRLVTREGREDEAHPILNRIIPFVLLIYVWLGAYSGAGSLLSTTVEEKFTRVMEILLSAVSPFELMVGKILGQLAVGGLVMAVYVSLGMIVLSSFALIHLVDPMLLLYLLIFFVTTYFIVGSVMGAVGAAVNDLRDAQTLLTPLNIIMMLPWLLAFPIVRNPDSALATVLSFVPPVNGFAMLLRLSSNSPPPAWQVALSVAASLAAAAAALWFAAKIFRIALLIHGKPPNIATLLRWARTA